MTFEEYLESKKINPLGFKSGDLELYNDFYKVFEHVSPASFTQQKLFLINSVRRKYPIKK
jgi:hypothetical protein